MALDGHLGQLLAQGVGLALDELDALERGAQLGAGGLGVALAVALDALERRGELVAGGLDGLLVLGADALELGDQVVLLGLGVAAAELLELEDARLEGAAGAVGAAAGSSIASSARRVASATAVATRPSIASAARARSASARSRRWASSAREASAAFSAEARAASSSSRARSRRSMRASRLEVRLVVAALLDLGDGALEVGAQAGGLALGGLGAGAAGVDVAAGLLDLRGQRGGHPLEVVDALHRRQQARHHGGRVVEVADRAALDARVVVGQALLDVGVLLGAGGLARGELLLDPGGRLGRAEDDERAGGAPALPGLRLGLDRLAERAHDDRVLLAHAQQHQVQRQLEAEVLEEQREVEALVELDGDEDGLDRELVALGVQALHGHAAGHGRRVAVLEERLPGLRVGAERGVRAACRRTTGRGSPGPGGRTAARPARTTWRPSPGRR